MPDINVDGIFIGNTHPCYIIAEAGVNHNGNLSTAKKMVDVAKKAGANAIKFQTFKADKLLLKDTPKAKYSEDPSNPDENFYTLLKKLELDEEMHHELIDYCSKVGITFLSTPFDKWSVDLLDSLGISAFKVSSGDIDNLPFFEYLISKKKPILFSTGTANFDEVRQLVSFFRAKNFNQLVVFQCTSSYPTPFEYVNLNVLKSYQEAFPEIISGFSDHSPGIYMGIAAVALGAKVIEKHFTLDKSASGPDHKASLEPPELSEYIKAIRLTEKALGSPEKMLTEVEKDVKIVARKSIVARTNILAGTRLSSSMLTTKRPAKGISPSAYYQILGKKVKRNILEDEYIKWQDLEE